MEQRFLTVDVFTDRIFGGNPLAVFPEADAIDPALMQRIAGEFNLSETAFVLSPDDPSSTRRLRIFTPAVELPFAGHPTVGSAHVLAAIGALELTEPETNILFEEGVGPVPVSIRVERGQPISARLTAAKLPERGPPAPSREHLAKVLGISAADILESGDSPEAWSAGVPFLFIPLADVEALGRARIDVEAWRSCLSNYWAPHIVPFARSAEIEVDVQVRMFAPQMGIVEDPATGAAAAAFAGYLAARDQSDSGRLSWTVAQGIEMGRPSRLHIDAKMKDGEITSVQIGGASVLVSQGRLHLPG